MILIPFSLGEPWTAGAACAESPDDVFFSPDFEGKPEGADLGRIKSETAQREVVAKTRYCSVCPIRRTCELEGWDQEFGTWGGWSPSERDGLKAGTYRPSPVKRPVSARRDQAVKLIRDGLSVEDVAIKMEISAQSVADYLRQNWVLTVGVGGHGG